MMLKDLCANIIVRSVGMIKLQVLTTTSQFCVVGSLLVCMCTCLFLSPFVVLEAVLPHHWLYATLLLHFIYTVAILAVVLRIFFILCFKTKLICRFATVYIGWLERTRSNQTHIPSRSISEWFDTIWFNTVLVYTNLEVNLIWASMN